MIPEIFNARVAQHKKAQKTRGRHQARRIIPAQQAQQAQQMQQPQQDIPQQQGQVPTDQTNGMQQTSEAQINVQGDIHVDPDMQMYPDSLNPVHPHKSPDEYSSVLRSELPSTTPWKSFAPKPLHIFFDSQHASEEILLLLRKHPIVLIPKILGSVLFAFFPLFISSLGLFAGVPLNYVFATYILWYLLLAGFMLETFLTWFFHVFIITDERIIDVDFISLIYKRITAAKIDNIEDVTSVTGGAIRSVFDFGTVKIQTAGARAEIAFEDVPSPAKVKRLLNELVLEEEREKIEGRVN
jgi:membrane protein YdbS with pleckstrin-like domain